jgi:hypothetical protein
MSGSPQGALSVGSSALANLRTFVGRGAKTSAPITAVCGAIADLASTIGRFSLYLFIFALCTALVSGLLWFLHYRRQFVKAAADGTMQPEEVVQLGERNVWSVMFAFSVVASVVMGGFVLAEKLSGGEDKGVLATVVPGMDKVQASLFRIEGKIDDVKSDTVAIRSDTSRIATSVEAIATRFDALAKSGGIIAGADTPEEHYHNARVHELGGNFAAARKEYSEYLTANLELLDPWQSYAAMLKAQEGRAGAAETLRYFADKLQPRTVSYQTALALLEDGEPRIAKLQALAAEHPDFGPLAFLVSQEYSEARRGDQTLADQRLEKEWLEKFRAAHTAGKFERYFLDKKEAQKWIETADARWAKLASTPGNVLDNPVSITAQQSSAGWAVIFSLSDFRAKELFYKLDGACDFQSTGHLPYQNPQTGLPSVNTHVPLPNLTPGEHSVEVKYLDKNGQTNGPYTLKFSTDAQQLAQAKMMLNASAGSWIAFHNTDPILYFTTLMTHRAVLREVRYSLNSDALDKTFAFKPTDKPFEVGDDIYLKVPADTASATVQITLKDGTVLGPQKVTRSR